MKRKSISSKMKRISSLVQVRINKYPEKFRITQVMVKRWNFQHCLIPYHLHHGRRNVITGKDTIFWWACRGGALDWAWNLRYAATDAITAILEGDSPALGSIFWFWVVNTNFGGKTVSLLYTVWLILLWLLQFFSKLWLRPIISPGLFSTLEKGKLEWV